MAVGGEEEVAEVGRGVKDLCVLGAILMFLHSSKTGDDFLQTHGISVVYPLRWNIEKALDQQEQKLDEGKAWATSDTAK